MSDNRMGLQGPTPDERPRPDGRRSVQGIRIDPEVKSEHEPRHAIFSAIVEDEPGTLSRVVGLAACRQLNIEGLTVDLTAVEGHSRITVAVGESEPGIDQIEKQLMKLKPVISVGELNDDTVRVELVFLKVHGEDPNKVHAITKIYDGRTLGAGPETIAVQLAGNERKIDDTVNASRRFGVIKIARTGQTALAHGSEKTVLREEPGTPSRPTKPNTGTR